MADVVIAEGLVVHPGETLVVRAHPHTNPAEAAEFRNRLMSHLPEGVLVVVVAAEQLAVVQGGGDRG